MELIQDPLAVAIVISLVEVFKQVVDFGRLLPVFALTIGVGIAIVFHQFSPETFIYGLVYGLIAMGAWSGVKATIKR